MRRTLPYFATALVFALAACGDSSDGSKTETPAPATPEAASDKSAMESATEVAAKAMEALKLDASSLDAFKSSLGDMQGSLSGEDRNKLMEALGGMIAKDGNESGGGSLLDRAKKVATDAASGKSMEEQLYDALGDKLDGLTFDDILKMAG